MPGSPWPVLGSHVATIAVAAAAGVAVVLSTVNQVARNRSPRAVAAVVGVSTAVLTLALWAVVRAWSGLAFPDYGGAHLLAGWLVAGFVALVALAGGTAYAYSRWRYVSALLALFAATAFTWYGFLLVGGETDVLWVWVLVYAPVLMFGAGLLVGLEHVVRRQRRGAT